MPAQHLVGHTSHQSLQAQFMTNVSAHHGCYPSSLLNLMCIGKPPTSSKHDENKVAASMSHDKVATRRRSESNEGAEQVGGAGISGPARATPSGCRERWDGGREKGTAHAGASVSQTRPERVQSSTRVSTETAHVKHISVLSNVVPAAQRAHTTHLTQHWSVDTQRVCGVEGHTLFS